MQYADDHSQRQIPDAELAQIPWRVIAVKRLPRWQWEITEHCPFIDDPLPLKKVHEAVKRGQIITAHKRIAYGHYELWMRYPSHSWVSLAQH
jgi:hypothetical protein